MQRKMRQMASRSPFIGPCLRSASMAYAEQVGVKRQQGGFKGDIEELRTLVNELDDATRSSNFSLELPHSLVVNE